MSSTHAPSGNGSEPGAVPRRYGDEDISGIIKDQQYMRETFAQFRIEDRQWKEKADERLDKVLELVTLVKVLAGVLGLGLPAVIGIAAIVLRR